MDIRPKLTHPDCILGDLGGMFLKPFQDWVLGHELGSGQVGRDFEEVLPGSLEVMGVFPDLQGSLRLDKLSMLHDVTEELPLAIQEEFSATDATFKPSRVRQTRDHDTVARHIDFTLETLEALLVEPH